MCVILVVNGDNNRVWVIFKRAAERFDKINVLAGKRFQLTEYYNYVLNLA